MYKSIVSPLFAALFLLPSALCTAQDTAPTFPFVMPWDDASKTLLDVSGLNPVPAGVNGQIVSRNGHFYDEKGNRVRFLGVSIAGPSCFPEKAVAEKVAARLHKFGINIVRFHHMDADWAKPNIWSDKHPKLNPASLDKLDYFIAKLKENGVYANLNLHVARNFKPEEGFPDAAILPDMSKQINYAEPRMLELQKQYARDLLTHVNPYTGKRYADDPCVAIIETTNENSLVGLPWEQQFSYAKWPAAYQTMLRRQWNDWLKEKYKNTDGLRRAWSATDKPFGPNLLLNADFSRGAERWTLEINTAPASAKLQLPEKVAPPEGATGKVVRVQVETITGQNWHIQFHQTGLDLTEGEPYTVQFYAKADKARPLGVYTSLDKGDYHNIGLQSSVGLTTEWQKYSLAFNASRTLKEHNRVTFVLGDSLGTVDLAGITLRPGVETDFPKNASLDKGDLPLASFASNPMGQDWIAFLIELENRYYAAMRNTIKKEIGAKANLLCSQTEYGGIAGVLRESKSDLADSHAYWQHPDFPHQPWDPKDWRIANTSMVRDAAGGTLASLALYRQAGKPFTVSEYNHPAPGDYQAETVPMIAAFAALQDWDGFYLFDYAVDPQKGGTDKITGFFDIATNPAKIALLPAAATLFLRNDMGRAFNEMRLRLPAGDIPALIGKNGKDITPFWAAAGISPTESLTNLFSVSLAPGKKPMGAPPSAPPPSDVINRPEGKGPLSWTVAGEDKPVFTADAPASKVMVGFLGGKSVPMNGWIVQMSETPRNFAALMLTAIDGKPTELSRSLLLTAVGSMENTGMVWNAERNSVTDQWGIGPTRAEGIPAVISVRIAAPAAKVYALDATGKRLGDVPSKVADGMLTFTIGPQHKTLFYEIETGTVIAKP